MLRFVISLRPIPARPASLVLGAFVLALVSAPCIRAEEQSANDRIIPDFSAGAQGEIGPSIPHILNEAADLARRWEDRLDIQTADDFKGDLDIDLDQLRNRALDHPRVRALLNADDGQAHSDPRDAPRYGSDQVFLFASFSMPRASLQALMAEAHDFGVPVLFNGFVNNSVFDTREALLDVFGSDEDIIGFSIDPTMFARFGVEAVPAVVITAEPLQPCATVACSAEMPPPHDIVRGNIPLIAALDLSIRAGAEGSETSKALRAAWEAEQ